MSRLMVGTVFLIGCAFVGAAQAANVLMVGANPDPSFGDDLAVYDHLTETLGLDVNYLAGDVATRQDGADADLIIISSTLGSGAVRGKFTGLSTPILNWEEAIVDGTTAAGNLAMGTGGENGTANPGTEVRILNSAHPLAAGFSGVVQFASTAIPRPHITGNVAPGVLAIASLPGITDLNLAPAGTGLHLGSNQTGGNAFTGLMDEMAIWDRALSFQLDANRDLVGGEIFTVYQQGVSSLPGGAGAPIGYWSFDDVDDDAFAADASGNGFDAALTGGAAKTTSVPGQAGGAGAIEVDGTGILDVVDIERPGGELSYSFWFQADSSVYGPQFDTADPRVDFFYGNGGGGGTVRPHLSANRNGRPLGLYVNNGTDLAAPIEATTTTFSSDEWHHVFITWDGATGSVFIDGRLDNQVKLAGDTMFAITAVEPGGILTDGTSATARIVNFPIQDVGFASLTDEGLQLFDAAINWLLDTTPSLPGDFDKDGVLSEADINLLNQAVAGESHPAAFDLDGNGFVNQADVNTWVVDLKQTWVGDANLDGEFNSGDFVLIFQQGKFEQDLTAAWGEGDWNGDLRFNSGDFVAAFQGGGFELGPRAAVAPIPEPSGLTLLGMALLTCSRWRRWQSICQRGTHSRRLVPFGEHRSVQTGNPA